MTLAPPAQRDALICRTPLPRGHRAFAITNPEAGQDDPQEQFMPFGGAAAAVTDSSRFLVLATSRIALERLDSEVPDLRWQAEGMNGGGKMQISLRVNTRDQEATARSASLMEELGGIVAEPVSPTDDAAWVPLRKAGRASDAIIGLRIDGSMLRQPFSLAWQLTRLQAATRKPLRILIAPSADDLDQRARQMLSDRASRGERTAWIGRAHRTWVAGTPGEVVRRLSALRSSGVEWLVLSDGLEAEVMAAELIADRLPAPHHDYQDAAPRAEPSMARPPSR